MPELKKTLAAVVAVLAILGGIYHGMRSTSESAPHDIDQVRARHLQTSSENAETRTDEKTESGTLDTQDPASEKTESGTLDTQGQPTASNVKVSSFAQTSGKFKIPPALFGLPFWPLTMKLPFNAVNLQVAGAGNAELHKLLSDTWVNPDSVRLMAQIKIAASATPFSQGPPQVFRVSMELPWAPGARFYAWLHAIDGVAPSGAFVYWKEDGDAVPDYLLRVVASGRHLIRGEKVKKQDGSPVGQVELNFQEIPYKEDEVQTSDHDAFSDRDAEEPNEVDGVDRYFYAPEVGENGAFVYKETGGAIRVFKTLS